MHADQNTIRITVVQDGTDRYVTTTHKGILHEIPYPNYKKDSVV